MPRDPWRRARRGPSMQPWGSGRSSCSRHCCWPAAFRYRQAAVPPTLLARINADLLAGPTERPGRCLPPAPDWRTVEGYSPWGDRHTYVIDECGRVHPSHGVALHPAGVGPDPTYLDPALATAIDRQAYGPVRDVREQ